MVRDPESYIIDMVDVTNVTDLMRKTTNASRHITIAATVCSCNVEMYSTTQISTYTR